MRVQSVKVFILLLNTYLNADFTNFLSEFKQMFNNSINTFIRQTSNEIIYEFNLTDIFDVIVDNNARNFEAKYKIH